MITRPMLAARLTNWKKIKYPVLATPKIDGIRCLIIKGKAVSRTFKPIPNNYIRDRLEGLPNGLDGELIVGNFQDTTSGVMSIKGTPDFKYMIFDYLPQVVATASVNLMYVDRMSMLTYLPLQDFCVKVLPLFVNSWTDLNTYEEICLRKGFEGVMIRTPDSPYKCGRSTEREGYLIKIKRFLDAEAIIVGFEEQMENTNSKEQDNFGLAKRSYAQQGKVGKDTLGAFFVVGCQNSPFPGKEFKIGTGIGLTEELRQVIWRNQCKYLRERITYKYQPHGVKDLPRCPVFLRFRDKNL